jgi:hypothetical protein
VTNIDRLLSELRDERAFTGSGQAHHKNTVHAMKYLSILGRHMQASVTYGDADEAEGVSSRDLQLMLDFGPSW